ncbi:MAG: hypothetical protein JWR21_2088 [Herminiimonas sp.]|nr:hypothetical protein [Herminiimonas sp.]MDB5854296.1 hypothetical protein [Herminiimonas sp.]
MPWRLNRPSSPQHLICMASALSPFLIGSRPVQRFLVTDLLAKLQFVSAQPRLRSYVRKRTDSRTAIVDNGSVGEGFSFVIRMNGVDMSRPLEKTGAGVPAAPITQGNKMVKFESLSKPSIWTMTLLVSAMVAGCGGGSDSTASVGVGGSASLTTTPGAGTGTGTLNAGAGGNGSGSGTVAGRGPAAVDLRSSSNFAILAQSAITNVPTSAVTGDVGLSPATGAGIGLSCAQVTGVIYTADAAGPLPCRVNDATRLTAAIADKGTAYTDAAGRAPDYTELASGNLGGLNLSPATYKWSTPVLIPTDVTLTGGPNDVWIFQVAQGMTVGSGVKVILAGGALPQNIFWQTFGAAEIGTTAQFKGVILSQTSIAMKTGASINGRLMAGTAVTLDQNVVTKP